jgi:pyridoxal phosphate enzyme (YggS family)
MSRPQEISTALKSVQERIEIAAVGAGRDPGDIRLIAVTKNFPLNDAQILYELGLRDFGENRDQEGALKSEQLPTDLRWHFQGQIQSRKIKSISTWADTVHSLDSLEHARKFAALPAGTTKEFFVQINLEPERLDRGGVALGELDNFLIELTEGLELKPAGLMTVAPIALPPLEAFLALRKAQEERLERFPSLTSLSMGMSGDFEDAIRAGATHLRIGSSILGSRGLPA